MSSAVLPLSQIVDVVVLISPQAPSAPTFNQGLIVGSTTSNITHTTRVTQFSSASAMLSAGFTTNSPEYIAAELYFSQLPPATVLWVGFQDPTSLLTVVPHAGSAGTGYVTGDVIAVTQAGGSGGWCSVTASAGVVQSLTVLTLNDGTGYSAGGTHTNLATTNVSGSGLGSGLFVDISAVGEDPLTAIENCRAVQNAWYGCYSTTAVKADHEAIALYAQSTQPPMMYFYNTADADALAGSTGNVFSYMESLAYDRVFGIYSTTQGGLYPQNVYAGAACMGIAMGLNTGLASSYFTMWGKVLTGIATEPLSTNQVAVITGNNGNLFLNYGAAYDLLTPGKLGSGKYLDLILFLDVLVSLIQFNIMDLLTSQLAVPLNDAGEQQLIHAVNQACQQMAEVGFISGGVWTGVQLLKLVPGMAIPQGYLSQAYSFTTQLASDRAARKAMPIYTAIIATDAVQSVLIGLYVQQ